MQTPLNPLEIALARAADEPAERPEFYKALLESDVYVIGHTDTPGDGLATIPAGSQVSIVNLEKEDGTPFIPFFSSLDALQRVLHEETRFVSMSARSFLDITRGATVVLNPESDYGKEFLPNEIDALLATGLNHVAAERVVQKATRVLLAQPETVPSDMVAALTAFLKKHAGIKAAYLCVMHEAESTQAPTWIVGLEGDGDMDAVMRQAGSVAADTAPRGEPVDFVRVQRGDGGLSDHFTGLVKPFYKRSWGATLRAMLSSAGA
ncbi:enhanced serine sensitivity protein SseB C-terminal domain-containing protein [Luteimonas sp. 3794]|uniref:enhanced serine sensitivity protein SseB C-terminal domain-containing protein n=1 Tax=Luteimonas sp. 3794 TaxID=2817730 RepID=UPI00285A4824|nr:enhanced serine sensitivity protein SseB C-terminal domain-containing protein [Luteimonas sp. 3794]MDR6990159.1 hypothetical protein [Luteimonas sp. 3794]